MSREVWIVYGLVLGALSFSSRVAAGGGELPGPVAEDPFDAEYRVDVWETENGLPQNSVTSIAQTPDGFLWLGTFNGLVRFDGVQFVTFDTANTPELKSSRIVTIHVDRPGRLWVTSEFGDVAMWEGGRFTAMNGRFGLPPGAAFQEAEDPDGDVWVWAGPAADRRYYRLSDGVFTPAPGTSPVLETDLESLAADAHGRPWARRSAGWVPVARSSLASLASFGLAAPGDLRVAGPSRDGGIWLGTSRGLWELRQGRWENHGTSAETIGGCTFVLEDREGTKWVGTWGQGLWRVDRAGGFHLFRLTRSRRPVAIRSAFEDREGNLWFGTDGAGLYRLKRRAFMTYDSDHGLSADVVNSVTEDTQGTLWVLTEHGIDWVQPGPPLRLSHRFDLAVPWTAAAGAAGRVWVGTYGGEVYRYAGHELVACSGAGSTLPKSCTVLFLDRRQSLWVGSTDGLWRMAGAALEPVPAPSSMPTGDIRAIAEDGSGALWLGFNGAGVLRMRDGHWETDSQPAALAKAHVWSLYADAEDALWIGTVGNGLSRLRGGQCVTFPPRLGLPRTINCIVEDHLGNLWLGSNDGIVRVPRHQLETWADGVPETVEVLRYDRTDGLGSGECNGGHQPAAWKGRDGRLWFATVRGLAVVDPGQLPVNTNLPPVVIEAVEVNGQAEYPAPDRADPATGPSAGVESSADRLPRVVDSGSRDDGGIIVPPGNQRLEIHYAALSLTAPDKTRFRCRLAPLDRDWTDAGGRRVAYYQGLPPGAYRFEVIGCNNDGLWNQAAAGLDFRVLPFFWQTRWFEFVVVAGSLGGVGWWLSANVTRLLRQRAEQQAFSRRLMESQEAERKRIAAELHDSLGQNLLIIKNRAVLALNHSEASPGLADQLGEISQVASQSIEDVRQIAHNLRPYQLDRLGLTKAIRAAVNQIAKSSTIAVRSQIDPVDGLFPPDLEINLYRIVQESLNNIVKHSQAEAASVLVERSVGQIRLKIDDDGRGFNYAGASEPVPGGSGLGLTSLAERTRILGGRLSLDSAPGRGTHLLIEIPLPNADHEKGPG